MNRHINVIQIVGLSVAALVAPPGIAVANPLLSGYGGPGQGSQAILGSALGNGPPGGGGGGGGAYGSGSAAPRSGGGVGAAAVRVQGNAASTTAAAGGQGKSSGRPARGAGGQVKASRGAGNGGGVSFKLGEDVVHAAFGDGVVTGVEPDGVIVVRFAGDGSERKLMAEYAPVTRR